MFRKVRRPDTDVTEIDHATLGITSINRAIGFRPDDGWRQVDCSDAPGRPACRRRVTGLPMIAVIGFGRLNTRGSGRFLSVADDAQYLAERIVKSGRKLMDMRAVE